MPCRSPTSCEYVLSEACNSDMAVDADGDEIMLSATHQSQFTQSLLLFVSSAVAIRFLTLTFFTAVANTIRQTLYPPSDQILCLRRAATADVSYKRVPGRSRC